MLETCGSTGTPVEPDKTEGPSTVLVLLGIERHGGYATETTSREADTYQRVVAVAGQERMQEKGTEIPYRGAFTCL